MRLLILIVFSFTFLIQCNQDSSQTIKLAGEAQGTTYHITYLSKEKKNYQQGIDSILKSIDSSLSTYVPVSIISRFNKNDNNVVADKYFIDVFTKSVEVSEKTGGFFDATVAPVINAWGFGFTKKANVDSTLIDSLLQLVGYKMVKMEGNKIIKAKPNVMLDFNAIAQGYTVDVLATYLESKGISNYLVELGGEVKAKGKKQNNEYWKIGIDKPNETATDERQLQVVITLNDKALATSGNYRKYYEENGKKFSHIINPRTGYPAKNNLLSATVIADDCMTADAYATAFMVMGFEKAKEFLSANKELRLEVFFVYDENGSWKTYNSDSMRNWMQDVP
jgi:thiamine biosynthesis lipoprotein